MISAAAVQRLGRDAVRRWLPRLDDWLLPLSVFGVEQTWPLLYGEGGDGQFFGLLEDGHLLSHCAGRLATLHVARGQVQICLLGSVVTDPTRRGQGLAGCVLDAALDAMQPAAAHALLWAERPELYARRGFVAGPSETVLLLARRPRRQTGAVRAATAADLAALHALHAAKPWRVARSSAAMAVLLATPGSTTLVLERDGVPVAYATCGKGADLQGHWHDLGGADGDLAALLPAAMHLLGQIEAALLLPPYRTQLATLLADHVVGEITVPGPMVRSCGEPLPPFWIDGFDSI